MQGSLLGFVDRTGRRAARDGQPAGQPTAPAPSQPARRGGNAFVSMLRSQLRSADSQPAEQPLPAATPRRAADPRQQAAAAPPPRPPAGAAPSHAGWQPCPLCGESFPPHKLQQHVEEELAFLEDDDPNPAAPIPLASQQRKPWQQQRQQQQQRRAPPV